MSSQPEVHEVDGHTEAAITRRTAELVVGVLLCLFAILVMVSNYQLGAGWASDGPQAGYFPFRLGVAVFLGSLFVLRQAWISTDKSAFIEKGQLRLVATVLLPLIVFVAAIQFTGIYLASAVFIGAFMVFIGKFSWWKALLTGCGTTLALFWIFENMFQVPLPKGPLEALFGY
jgi:putative tricarboxylic transport membrane protein